MLGPKERSMEAFSQSGVRRITYSELRDKTKILRGSVQALMDLRKEGSIHYQGSLASDTVIISLCRTLELQADYKLVILAPDEAVPSNGELVWQVLVSVRDDWKGIRYPFDSAKNGLIVWVEQFLYNQAMNNCIDAAEWPRIEAALIEHHDEYRSRQN